MKKTRFAAMAIAMALALAVLSGLTAFLPGTVLAADTVTVIVDGRLVSFPDAPAYVDEKNRTQIPTRYVGEALGAEVEWDKSARRATFSMGSGAAARRVDFYIGSNVFYIKNSPGYIPERQTMDTAAVIGNSRTYVPVRFLAEAFGATVHWDAASKTVRINSPSAADGQGTGQHSEQGAWPGDKERYDEDGLYLAQYANAFYQQWYDTLQITYEGERVFVSYTLPEGIPEEAEFRITLSCDVVKNEKNWRLSGWQYVSFERSEGHREEGREYLIPSPVSGYVKKELRYIPFEDIKWIYININLVTPRNAYAWETKKFAQSSYRVDINALDMKDSVLNKHARDGWGIDLVEHRAEITIDGASIVKFK